MTLVYAYFALALTCCSVAAVNGGRDGRWAAFFTISALTMGRVVGSIDLQVALSPQYKIFLDGVLLIAFATIMLTSKRYWPIWITGLQLNGVLAHLAAWLSPAHVARTYHGLESVWGVPIVVLMALGPTLDRRAGIPSR